jgi:hypothetical protein
MRTWTTGVAVVLGIALAAYPLAVAPEGSEALAIGGAGLGFMVLALVSRRARGLGLFAGLLLALHYAVALHAANVELDGTAPLVAVGIFAFVEAIDLSTTIADVAPMSRPALARRLRTTALLAAAGGGLALLAVLARSLFAGAIAGVVVGAACILGIVALPLLIAQRARDA